MGKTAERSGVKGNAPERSAILPWTSWAPGGSRGKAAPCGRRGSQVARPMAASP